MKAAMHREYYTWKFLTTLVVPPVLIVLGIHLAFREKVVRSWDFTALDPAQWQWRFSGENPHKEAGGAAYVVFQTSLGPELDGLNSPADEFGAVRILIQVRDLATGQKVPTELLLYWARESDLAAAREPWPMSSDRVCGFRVPDAAKPDVFIAQPARSRQVTWEGKIQSLRIAVKVPAESSKGYNVVVSSIEFVR
jgi:hypothetical protein